jgi:hypothetical protein
MARRYRRRSYYSSDIGHERARQHIEDYRRLEAELGGSLEDVKQYFFGLGPSQLRQILLSYGQKYGESARDYAERTIAKWKSNRVHMAGQTAERLFRLLPTHMPLESKYRLIENLWNHVGARTRKTLRIGLNANVEQVMEAVRKHLEDVVVPHRIPPALEGRFNWLAAGDAQLKQELLNHLRQHMEKSLVVEAARLQLPTMQEHLRGDAGRQTVRLAQILKLGNHELELLIDKNASGVAIDEPQVIQAAFSRAASVATGQRGNFKWLWWAAAAAVALYFFVQPQAPKSSYQPSSHATVARQQTPVSSNQPNFQAPVVRPQTTPGSSYQDDTHAAAPSQSDIRLPAPPQSKSALARPSDSNSDEGISDHGPGRVACDVRWSDLQRHGAQNSASGYQDFLRNCMSEKRTRRPAGMSEAEPIAN